MTQYSPDAAAIWKLYAEEFEQRWGMDCEVSAVVGARSKQIFAAEYHEHGDNSYRDSVILPIRNAFYAASAMDARWSQLKSMGIKEPILDYGCGVGFQLLWLKRHGFSDLYGFEIPGIQHEVMARMFRKHGIKEWDGEQVETVFCINVLEHIHQPVKFLEGLMRVGRRVIANICTAHDSPHIAPHDELEKCRVILEGRESLYRAA